MLKKYATILYVVYFPTAKSAAAILLLKPRYYQGIFP
jgi:hypothetical protein